MSSALNPAPDRPSTSKSLLPAKEAQMLLVDDSPTMRLYLRRLLESLFPGCLILEAEDGMSALRSLTTARVDMIITDLQMPGMDGQNLVQVLRRNPLLRKKPILVVSGALDDATLQDLRALGDGPMACLTKPVHPDDLHRAVTQLLT